MSGVHRNRRGGEKGRGGGGQQQEWRAPPASASRRRFRLQPLVLPAPPAFSRSGKCPLPRPCSGMLWFLAAMSPLMQYCSFSIHLSKAQIKVLHDFRCCTSSDVDIVYFYLFLTLAHQVTRTFIVNFFYILSNLIIYLEHTSSNVLKNN